MYWKFELGFEEHRFAVQFTFQGHESSGKVQGTGTLWPTLANYGIHMKPWQKKIQSARVARTCQSARAQITLLANYFYKSSDPFFDLWQLLATPGILAHLGFLTSGTLAEFSGHCHPGLPCHSMETQVPGHAREGQERPVPCTFPDATLLAEPHENSG